MYNSYLNLIVMYNDLKFLDISLKNVYISSNCPENLEILLQMEADSSVSWVKDNRLVCSGNKTKLLVIGTKELRTSKLESSNLKLSVKVDGHAVIESSSEKLLGMVINNTLT